MPKPHASDGSFMLFCRKAVSSALLRCFGLHWRRQASFNSSTVAESSRVASSVVWADELFVKLENSQIEGLFPSNQTIRSHFALLFHTLGCSPQGVNVVL